MDVRRQVLRDVAARIPGGLGHPVRVAIDGITGAGKTTFRAELAAELRRQGREVIEASGDDFHHQQARRWKQGRRSARGYYEDAYDYGAMAEKLLRPLGDGGDRVVQLRHHDLDTDAILDSEPHVTVPPGAVLVVEGSFLMRPEIAPLWEYHVLLEASLDVSALRQVARDGAPGDATDPYHRRYFGGYDIYVAERDPLSRADLVIDNNDLDAPRVVKS